MTFSSALPHLAAGRRIRRASWPAFGCIGKTAEADRWLSTSDLLASDWELADEPGTVTAGPHICAGSCQSAIDTQATITRLEQRLLDGLAEYRDLGGQLAAANKEVTRLTRELASSQRSFHALRDGLRGVLDAASEKP